MAERERTDPIASQPLVEKSLASRPAVAVLIGFNVEEISGGRPVGCLQAGPQRANPIRWTRYTEEIYAMWRTRQPDPRDREPRQSSCSISSRNRTSAWREPARCAHRRRQIVHSARADHHRATVLALFPLALHGERLGGARTRNGFTPSLREALMRKFRPLETENCPFTNLPEARGGRWGQGLTAAKMKECRWLKPVLVGQFEFREWTPDNHLRHSRFVALREDKTARDVVRKNGIG
jgi:hypothetical protein